MLVAFPICAKWVLQLKRYGLLSEAGLLFCGLGIILPAEIYSVSISKRNQ
jgi:hypothetical protein